MNFNFFENNLIKIHFQTVHWVAYFRIVGSQRRLAVNLSPFNLESKA